MNSFIYWVIDRLDEPSTWRGIIMLITGVTGFALDEEHTQAVIAAGISIVGLIGMFSRDKKVVIINPEPHASHPMSRNNEIDHEVFRGSTPASDDESK
jgi:hypothetical protein